MDFPLTVAKAVYDVATLVITKTDELDRLRKRKSRFAIQYKKSVMSLSEESKRLQTYLNALIYHGNESALNSLLNSSEGREALSMLSSSFAKLEEFLKTQDRAADALISCLKRYQVELGQTVAHILTVDDKEEKFEEVMEDASRKLDDFRSDLLSHFDHFKTLYELFSKASFASEAEFARMSSPERERVNHTDSDATAIDITYAFYQFPFHFSLANATASNIPPDNININKGGHLVSMMEEMGNRWVRDNIKSEDQTIESLSEAQTKLLEHLRKAIELQLTKSHYKLNESIQDHSVTVPDVIRRAHLADIKLNLDKEINRVNSQKFSIAFCGMVKAGKSLFLNALIGNCLLPSDDLPSTAWPCIVSHVKDQHEPSLELDPEYFQSCIITLREKQFGAIMEDYTPPAEHDDYSKLLRNENRRPRPQETKDAIDMREIHIKWIDLHMTTKKNLHLFEGRNYVLPARAVGREDVIDLLGKINDIIRLCGRFGLTTPATKPDKWPLLKVEFESLRSVEVHGKFEFIDLPGIGESNNDFHRFEELVKTVAKEVNAIVPIVSFKGISKAAWQKQLPEIIKAGLRRTQDGPDLVVCTNFDQNVTRGYFDEQIASVVKAFWGGGEGNKHRVMCCASRMGLGAGMLLNLSQETKPDYNEIWNEDNAVFDCVKKIIGEYDSQITYENMTKEKWNDLLQVELVESGLQITTKRLVNDLVLTAHRRLLGDEGSLIIKQLHKAISNEHRSLIEMQRTLNEHEKAFKEFDVLRGKYHAILEEWSAERSRYNMRLTERLKQNFTVLDGEIRQLLTKVLEKKIKEFSDAHNLKVVKEEDKIVFDQANFAELFLQQVQEAIGNELASSKKTFVAFVRKLATKSHTEHFDTLKEKIKTKIPDDLQLGLKEDILDELNDCGESVERMTFIKIRQKVMHSVAVNHTGSTAYRAIERVIASPFLKRDPVDTFLAAQNDSYQFEGDEPSTLKAVQVSDLGFMLKAPIAVIASLSWLLGSGIWPFMKQAEKIVMGREEFSDELNSQILRPFLESLKGESETTLRVMMDKSWKIAKGVVEDELEGEKKRYESEKELKQELPSEEALSSTKSTLLNFIAAESAMKKLNYCLKED